jgi:hypothetical protein
MDILDDMKFLEFVKGVLEEKIQKQEALIEAERLGFFDKQLDFELSKELHMYQRWRDEIETYILNKTILGDEVE